jgi:hypothetical protein
LASRGTTARSFTIPSHIAPKKQYAADYHQRDRHRPILSNHMDESKVNTAGCHYDNHQPKKALPDFWRYMRKGKRASHIDATSSQAEEKPSNRFLIAALHSRELTVARPLRSKLLDAMLLSREAYSFRWDRSRACPNVVWWRRSARMGSGYSTLHWSLSPGSAYLTGWIAALGRGNEAVDAGGSGV